MNRIDANIITDKLNKKLKDRFNFADKRYGLKARYSNYEEQIVVNLNFYEGSYGEDDIEALYSLSCLCFNIDPKDYSDMDTIIDDILIASKDHINKNFMDNETRFRVVENINKIMKKYNKRELINEYDEIDFFDYELYVLEFGIQCGGGYDDNFAFNAYEDKIYNLDTEKYIYYKNYEELRNIICDIVDTYINNLEEKIRKENEDEDEEDYNQGCGELSRDLDEIIEDIRIEKYNAIIEFEEIEPNLYLSSSLCEQEVYVDNIEYKYDYNLYDRNEGNIKIHNINIPINEFLEEEIEEIDNYSKWSELSSSVQEHILMLVDINEIISSIETDIVDRYEGDSTYNMMVREGWIDED